MEEQIEVVATKKSQPSAYTYLGSACRRLKMAANQRPELTEAVNGIIAQIEALRPSVQTVGAKRVLSEEEKTQREIAKLEKKAAKIAARAEANALKAAAKAEAKLAAVEAREAVMSAPQELVIDNVVTIDEVTDVMPETLESSEPSEVNPFAI